MSDRVTQADLAEYFGVPVVDVTIEMVRNALALRHKKDDAIRRPSRNCCGECPAQDGMYAPFAEMVLMLPEAEQEPYMDKWWCHCDTRFCCEGVRKYVARHGQSTKRR